MMDTKAFAKARGIRVEVLSDDGTRWDADGWEHRAFTLRLHRAESSATMDTDWRQGMGVTSSPEDEPGTVLDSLASDALLGLEHFDAFCGDLGYDTDSRKAFAAWEACQRTADQLATFLGGDDQRDRLIYDVARL